jgi:formylglycine-generating enzyme required for sulfatase activity
MKIIFWIGFVLMIMGCADKGTSVNTPAEDISDDTPISSSSSLTNSSIQELSSSINISSSLIHSSSSMLYSSSSVINSSSSSSLWVLSSSSQNFLFSDGQVRIPDGCGSIYWSVSEEKTCVQDFWVDTTEVTIGAYQKLMGDEIPSLFHNGFYLWQNPSGEGYADDGSLCPNCPVDGVTFYEAILYANKMTKKYGNPNDTIYTYTAINTSDTKGSLQRVKPTEVTGLENLQITFNKNGYRLPTRGEFSYIYYQGVFTVYPWDDLYSNTQESYSAYDLHSWNNRNSGKVTQEVATKLPTSWHLYDLIGNAFEWTTTPDIDNPGNYLAIGGSVIINGGGLEDIRLDSEHAGFRLVRGESHFRFIEYTD